MSASADAGLLAGTTPESLRGLRVLRYAVGSTLAMAVAMGLAWPLCYLTPVLALSFLGTPTPRPSLKEGVLFLVTIGAGCWIGLLLARHLLPYPEVYLPLIGLVLFRLFHWKAGGGPALLVTWLIIALLVLPLLAMQSLALATLVARGIVLGAAVTLGIVWLTYGLFPDPPGLPAGTTAAKAAGPPPVPPGDRLRGAVLSTAVVWPLVVAFYLFQWTGSLLVLVFVTLLAMQPAFAKSFRAGGALVVGNSFGGVASILAYELLAVVPLYGYLVLVTLLAAFLFGARLFSERKTAALYGMAFSTFVLIIGSVTTSSGDAGSKVYTRVLQIMIAVAYVVTVFGVLTRFFPGEESADEA